MFVKKIMEKEPVESERLNIEIAKINLENAEKTKEANLRNEKLDATFASLQIQMVSLTSWLAFGTVGLLVFEILKWIFQTVGGF